jgi:sensor c-di-GMP phosphodiesterase-like protein
VKRTARRLLKFCAGAALLAAVPLAGGLVYGHYAALERTGEAANAAADELAAKVRSVLWAAEGILADVDYLARTSGCSDALIQAFSSRTSSHAWISAMAYVTRDRRLACTSFGAIEPPVPIGDPVANLIRSDHPGIFFTPAINPSFMPGEAIVAIHVIDRGPRAGDWVAILIPPRELFDQVPPFEAGDLACVRLKIRGVPVVEVGDGRCDDPEAIEAVRAIGLFDAQVVVSRGRRAALDAWRAAAIPYAVVGIVFGLVLIGIAARIALVRPSLTQELRDAIENGDFEVCYQPTVDLHSGRCVGAEALVRWRHPERGMVAPDLFIAIAEETGDIIPLTRWLLGRIGADLASFLGHNPELHVGVNLAPVHLQDPAVVADVRAVANACGLPLEQILFEITERSLVDETHGLRVIRALISLGASVAIDDFGTGYSSLAYLEKFPFHYLKIDKAFVRAIGTGAATAGLADVIIAMARTLELKTIAEGVETEAQAAFLRERGVARAQGWLFAKPLPADEFVAFAQARNRQMALAS